MFTPATAIAIESPTIQQLESLVRSGNTPQRIALRCRVILLAGQGVANHSIARELGLSRPTVIAARAAFEDGGVEALTAKPTRKRSRRVLTPELEREILDTTLKTRSADATQWSVRTLAKQMHVSRMMVYRVWQRFDIQPHRVEKFKLSNDPHFEEKGCCRTLSGPAGPGSGALRGREEPDLGPGPDRSNPAIASRIAGTPDL